jgi:hypothetical protein
MVWSRATRSGSEALDGGAHEGFYHEKGTSRPWNARE